MERIRYSDGTAPSEEGFPRDLYDWMVSDESMRMLRNWDPDKPQAVTPLNQGTVSAQIFPSTRKVPGRDAPRQLLWTFSCPSGDDERRSLRELVKESPSANIIGQDTVDGHRVWHIRVQHPGIGGVPVPGCFFDIYLDPEANYAIRRVGESQDNIDQLINGVVETYTLRVIRTVQEFKSLGDGVFVPVKIQNRVIAATSDKRESVTDITLANLAVNEAVDDRSFDYSFPKDIQVVYYPSETPKRQRVALWGPGDKPAKEIRELMDIPGYKEARDRGIAAGGVMRTPTRAPNDVDATSSYSVFFWSNIGIMLVLVVIVASVWVQRRSRKSQQ